MSTNENARTDQISGAFPLACDLDPDTAVMLEIEAHDAGLARGLVFRLAEGLAEIEAWEASRSPCGLHLHPLPVAACRFCAS